ncbi:MAG: LptF/LptG family permease [Fimbriimonadales bacterium]|nr:LptF/LptG family permease [Fimbriimonadales bacterium]
MSMRTLPPFTRLDRYIAREMLTPLGIGVCAILLMLIGNLLFNYAPWFFNYGVPVAAVAQMVLYYTPYLLVLSLPVGAAVGTALTVNRLTRDSEITVLRMAGVSLRRIFAPMMLIGALLSGVNFALNEYLVPPSMQQFNKLRNRIFLLAPVPNLTSNAVIKAQNYIVAIGVAQQQGARVLLEDVLMIERREQGGWLVVKAPRGEYHNGVWTLHEPSAHYYQPDGAVADVRNATRLMINLQVALQDFFTTPTPEEQTMAQLYDQIQRNRAMGLDTRQLEVSYHLKAAVPAACLILALCAPVLSFLLARAGGFVGVLLSIVLVFVFWNTLLLFQILGNYGFLPPMLAAWSPNLLFGAGGLLLLRRLE